MGPPYHVAGVWAVTTALTVLGVNAAIERVADEVIVARPAPMTADDVDDELREQQGPRPTTTAAPASTTPTTPPTIGRTAPQPSIPSTGSRPTTSVQLRPGDPDPSGPGGPPVDSTTTVAGASGRHDQRDEGPRP